MSRSESFTTRLLAHWDSYAAKVKAGDKHHVDVDGHGLDLATVVAIAR
jgi:hypothetical protein